MLLTANIAFLAIPGIDGNNGSSRAIRVLIDISVITSMGGILAGLLLARRYDTRKYNVDEVVSGRAHIK